MTALLPVASRGKINRFKRKNRNDLWAGTVTDCVGGSEGFTWEITQIGRGGGVEEFH